MNLGNCIQGEVYFITITVVDWIDVFTRPSYKHAMVDSLDYCQKHKGLTIYAWVLMSNHLHAIVSAEEGARVSDIIRDLKKFTTKKLIKMLLDDPQESRREWLQSHFRYAAANDSKIKDYRFWQEGYYPEQLFSVDFFDQKLNYLHQNPVRQEIVVHPEDYLYSSARDYAGEKGLLDITLPG